MNIYTGNEKNKNIIDIINIIFIVWNIDDEQTLMYKNFGIKSKLDVSFTNW